MGQQSRVEPFINKYCEKMGEIISGAPYGRVDKFMGDGIMALFGEDLNDPNGYYKKVVIAVRCACKMVEEFQKLYQEWVKEELTLIDISNDELRREDKPIKETKHIPLQDLRTIFNENIQIDIAIGINIGNIFFDYFGDRTHREYTAIGDHVNFTQRLQSAAARFNELEHRMLTNILASQTAYQFLHDQKLIKTKNPLWIRFEGFGFAYPVYEIYYDDLRHDRIEKIVVDLINELYPHNRSR
jgi:class 3 adenylate cyclase